MLPIEAGLKSTTFRSPLFVNAGIHSYKTATHDYDGAHADWTLSADENNASIISATNANSGVNAIAEPTANKVVLVVNGTGQNMTVKASGQTGVVVANGTSVYIRGNGTDFVAVSVSAVAAATATASGIVELATSAEAVTGTDTDRAVTPAALTGRMAAPGAIGGTTPAAGHFTAVGLANFNAATHDYDGAHADWTLSTAEQEATVLSASNADQAVNAIATPTSGKLFIISNATGYALTFKATGQSGVAIPNGTAMSLRGNGTDFVQAETQWLSGYMDGVVIGSRTPAAITGTTLSYEDVGALTVDYAGAHADATVTLAQWRGAAYILATNADTSAANLIVPAKAKMFVFKNTSTSAVTVKVTGQTGIAVATGKYALLFNNGTDVTRITADT